MNDLPKRDDKIYKEIEEFKDYELTYCIAYEMAIRNDEVKRLFGILEDKKKNFKIDDNTVKIIQTMMRVHGELRNYGLDYITSNAHKYAIDYKIDNELVAYQYDNELNYSDMLVNKVINNKTNNKLNIIEKMYKPNFSRPQLTFKNSKIISVDINPALPKKELLAYIEKIKDDFDKGYLEIQTPAELLNEEIQKVDNFDTRAMLTKQKRLADMFFIYDYATYRMKEVKEYNERYKAELDEKLSFIKNDKTLTAKEKKIQEMEAKKEFIEAKSEAKIKSICNEDDVCNQVGLQGDSVYKYYLAIKPYIEEKRYKELITGVSIL